MIGFSTIVTGVAQNLRRMLGMPNVIQDEVDDWMQEQLAEAADLVEQYVPVRSGKLRDSIAYSYSSEGVVKVASIGSNVVYARRVHDKTAISRGQVGRNFIDRAVDLAFGKRGQEKLDRKIDLRVSRS